MDLCIVVHIKSTYDKWKAIFDEDPGDRNSFVDETRTRVGKVDDNLAMVQFCLLYTSPSPRDLSTSRMPSSA